MRPGDTCLWLDDQIVTLLGITPVEDPVELDSDETSPGWELGWTVQLIESGEILTVHVDTLDVLDN